MTGVSPNAGSAAKPVPDKITLKNQATAADPISSAWVSANAGSGKTYVLSTRVIRLMLSGVDPSKILCLTYTKTAASEMKNRVFDRLGEWTTMGDADLAVELGKITDKSPSDAEIAYARTLFASALETPGGLKIQTIHAFCEALLHRFPLEANIAGHFELIDEVESGFLISEARRRLLAGTDTLCRAAMERIIQGVGEAGFNGLLDEIIAQRLRLVELLNHLDDGDSRRNMYFEAFNLDETEGIETIKAQAWPLPGLTQEYCRDAFAILERKGAATAYDYLEKLTQWYGDPDAPPRFESLLEVFFTAEYEPRSTTRLSTNKVAEVTPDFLDRFVEAQSHLGRLKTRLNLIDEIEKTLDALAVADALLGLYSRLKSRRGYLDFEDLIQRTEMMLRKDNVAAWVRYKLDQGIDHILVDEAQDTSPAQWRVITTLADEFFDGASARHANRTVFAVGDEKQSIYSFQGADPKEFDKARNEFSVKVKRAEKVFKSVSLDASFRSTGAVLDAVDEVFKHDDHKRGLAFGKADVQRHRSLRDNQPGTVEVWDYERAIPEEPEEDWRKPYDHAAQPAVIVANRIADQIKSWLDEKACQISNGQPITAGDILVLVRKRDSFVHALSRALKERQIPVAGADRLNMTSHVAILDLMALGRIMLNRHDDLSLAALLRSPIFGWSDEDLFDIAHGRKDQSLYEALAAITQRNQQAAEAYMTLERWQTLAFNKPVFEFYSHVLGVDGARSKLIGRLGFEAGEMLDEFLNYAIAQERTGPVGLETFLNTLESFAPEIKREMEGSGDQIRIMTVHGAKGLEAPIVFLVDPGSSAHSAYTLPTLLPVELQQSIHKPVDGVLWRNEKKSASTPALATIENIKSKGEEEYRRLLYVGMTRAADKLIVAGYAGQKGGQDGTWLNMVWRSLEPLSKRIDADDNKRLLFPADADLSHATTVAAADSKEQVNFSLPACFSMAVPKEPPAARPLVPSGATGLAIEPDRADSDAERSGSLLERFEAEGTNLLMQPGLAVKRGTVVHKLLQILPSLAAGERRTRAIAYCRHVDGRWTDDDIEALVNQTLGLIDHPAFAAFFDHDARAEVSVMGTVQMGGKRVPVSGVVDRIAVGNEAVHIIDFKTNARPPVQLDEVPTVYRRQMALYHALVEPLYPEKTVKAALLFTSGPHLIELAKNVMDDALADMVVN